MTEKELLALAAKAHGGLVQAKPNGDWIHEDENGNRGAWWNPLTDDGDALRLAVKLGFNLFLSYPSGVDAVIGTGVLTCNELPPNYWSAHNGDPHAATRAAIVRAAAEIGRTKLNDLIKRIDDYLQGAGEELSTVILTDCKAALEAKSEPSVDALIAEIDALPVATRMVKTTSPPFYKTVRYHPKLALQSILDKYRSAK